MLLHVAVLVIFQLGLAYPLFGAAALAFLLSRSVRLLAFENLLRQLAVTLLLAAMGSAALAKAAIKWPDEWGVFSNLLAGLFLYALAAPGAFAIQRELAERNQP